MRILRVFGGHKSPPIIRAFNEYDYYCEIGNQAYWERNREVFKFYCRVGYEKPYP